MSQIPDELADALPPPLRATGADGATIEAHAHGAHLVRWSPAGESSNRLFLSSASAYRRGVAIRGGVPVIFPQFAAEGPLPRHGFARTMSWELQSAQGATLRFALTDTAATRAIWPHAFRAGLELAAAGRELRITLSLHNPGETALAFTAALHTYIAVMEIGTARLHGLQGLRYRDSARGDASGRQAEALLGFDDEIDRIYFDAPPQLQLQEPQRTLTIRQQGFRDTVVWNPGSRKAAALADLEPGGERRMLCIEAATVGEPHRLAPGAEWSGTQWLVAG